MITIEWVVPTSVAVVGVLSLLTQFWVEDYKNHAKREIKVFFDTLSRIAGILSVFALVIWGVLKIF
jgi:hypothetical protein